MWEIFSLLLPFIILALYLGRTWMRIKDEPVKLLLLFIGSGLWFIGSSLMGTPGNTELWFMVTGMIIFFTVVVIDAGQPYIPDEDELPDDEKRKNN
jgi:hypothetical protein